MSDPDAFLQMAEEVGDILRNHRIEAVIIGAVALAAHHYVRQTEDIDLGVNADVPALRMLTQSLRQAGFSAKLHEPDSDDPLGGVIDVESDRGLVQIISYANRFPVVIDDALKNARLVARAGSSLPVAPIPQLIALKLYAGGYKSKADIVELLSRNPEIDLAQIRATCRRYRISGLEELIGARDSDQPL